MSKLLKTKFSIPFINIFYKTFHAYNKLFPSNKSVFKSHKYAFICQTNEN